MLWKPSTLLFAFGILPTRRLMDVPKFYGRCRFRTVPLYGALWWLRFICRKNESSMSVVKWNQTANQLFFLISWNFLWQKRFAANYAAKTLVVNTLATKMSATKTLYGEDTRHSQGSHHIQHRLVAFRSEFAVTNRFYCFWIYLNYAVIIQAEL